MLKITENELLARLTCMYGMKTMEKHIKVCKRGLAVHLSGQKCPECVKQALSAANSTPKASITKFTEETLPKSYLPATLPKQVVEGVFGVYRNHFLLKGDKFSVAALRILIQKVDPSLCTRYEYPIPVFYISVRRVIPMFYSFKLNACIDVLPFRVDQLSADPNIIRALLSRTDIQKLRATRKQCLAKGLEYKVFALVKVVHPTDGFLGNKLYELPFYKQNKGNRVQADVNKKIDDLVVQFKNGILDLLSKP